jgi:hypothetical protein
VSLRIAHTVIETDAAPASSRRAIAEEWAASHQDRAANDVVDVSFEPVSSIPPPPAPDNSEEARADVIATLEAERRVEFGGFTHRHPPVGCAICQRSAAVYR